MKQGYCIEANYFELESSGSKSMYANYVDETGRRYQYKLNDFNPVINGDTVKLYYMEYVENAIPQTTVMTWIGDYLFFGAMLAFNIWKNYKIYRKPYFMRHQIEGLEV